MILFCFAMIGLGTGVALSGMIVENVLITFIGASMFAIFFGGLMIALNKKNRGDPV